MIKIKFSERPQPGVVGGGVKKTYAHVVTDGETSIDEIIKDIEKFSALSEPDIRGVVSALENVIQNKLAQSKIVRLEKLGSLYPSVSSAGIANPDNASTALIKEVTINYRPGERLKKAVNEAGFTVIK